MRITVTGAGGFIGSNLVRALTERGDEVRAWTRSVVDVTDPDAVRETLATDAPDAIVHLAAETSPTRSWAEPGATYRVNVGGAINVLEAARALPHPPRLLLAGTSAEYAQPPGGVLLAEDAPLEPESPYGSSKLAVDELGRMYGRMYGLEIVRFRPFSLVGPGKSGDVCSDFARRIVDVERGADPVLRVGNLTKVRDMIDIRDGVRAILRLLDAGASGEIYNLCGGRGVRIADVLDVYRRLATVPITVAEDPALLRQIDHGVKIGDPAKLRALGWAPAHALDDTLHAILDAARAR
jgi:GDP-4-dehydro-6-deoxy-D-mannose reductase